MQGWVPDIAGRDGPIYQVIADALAEAIAGGILRPGDRLPTHRALAEAVDVDLTTVTRAYAEARRRGLVEGTVGRGTFVSGAVTAPAVSGAVPASAGRDADHEAAPIDLTMNLPPILAEPSLSALLPASLSALLAGPARADLLTYRIGASLAERRAAADWLMPTVGAVAPERIVVAPGAQPALLAVLGLAAPPGAVVLTDALTYPGLRAAAAQHGTRLVGVAGDAHGMSPDALDAACDQHHPAALYVVPTIHNPTTATMPTLRRERLAAIARRRHVAIVEDDAYGLLPSTRLPALAQLAPDITWHVATVSKLLSPALRVAYALAPDADRTARLAAALRANTFMASPLLAGVVAAWLRDGTAGRILAAILREAVVRQTMARDLLPAGAFDAHPEGLHLWLRLPPRWGRLDFVAQARQRGLAVVPSDAFAVGDDPPDAVRVALGAAPSREALRTALSALAALLAQPGPAFSEIV
ncbi:MAG: PLP-dependent aminotransferase family protein [Alphaproteobacteria bacterium]|nr:PLP-dependent aminotransferase family protein [Alphaproteobacteria bacterium]